MAATDDEETPFLRSFAADSAMQAYLAQTMRTIRDNASDDVVRESIEDVLEGRRTLYDVFGDERFGEAVWDGVEQGLDAVLELEEDELARVAEGADGLFDSP